MTTHNLPVNSCLGLTPPQLVYIRKNSYSDMFHPPRQLHRHDFCEIRLVTDGSCDFIQNDKNYVLSRGNFVICGAGSFHAENFTPECDVKFLTVAFSGINIPGLPPNCLISGGRYPVHKAGERFETLRLLIETMYANFRAPEPSAQELVYHSLCAFLIEILSIAGFESVSPAGGAGNADRKTVSAIKKYIDLHYTEDLTLRQMGNELNFSLSLISHAFKREVGCSPIQYMTLLRIGEAQTLLTATDISITEIANMIGYNTSNNFYAMFKKNIGISPNEYRKNYLAIQK